MFPIPFMSPGSPILWFMVVVIIAVVLIRRRHDDLARDSRSSRQGFVQDCDVQERFTRRERKARASRHQSESAFSSDSEARLMQEIHASLSKMDRRIEALETILMDRIPRD